MSEVWTQVKTSLESKYSENKMMQTWLQPIQLLSLESDSGEDTFCLGTPSAIHKRWVSKNLTEVIRNEIAKIHNTPFKLEIKVNQDLAALQYKQVVSEKREFNLYSAPTFSKNRQSKIDNLNKDQTFDTFVVGPNNTLAYEACYHVSKNPGEKDYNPLFIYGPTGLGKSHLMHAIGNNIKNNKVDFKIRYLSAEKFLNECISSIRFKTPNKFRQKFREDCDILLIDDIPFLGRGENVQEEFCHTLNHLRENNRQVVVSSDKMPKDINGLEERIKNRLRWGLTADIYMPNLETRIAILKNKAKIKNVRMPQDVVDFIARISKKSIRELEGNLNKVKMFSELQGLNINLEIAKNVLRNHEDITGGISMEEIQRITADHHNIRLIDLKSKSRARPLVRARQTAMYLIKKHLHNKSLVEIGKVFGGKDHTTVINSLKRIENLLKTDSDFARNMEGLERAVQNITGL